MKRKPSDQKLLSGLFFHLLPYQVLLCVISAVNGIIDSLYASNALGKTAMSASISCFLCNIAFNHLLVVILHMGIFGLGLSSSLANWLFFIIQLLFYLSKKSQMRFSRKSFHWQEGRQILLLGYPGAISFSCSVALSL